MDNLFFDLITSLSRLVAPVFSALSPLIIGLILAYLLNPAVSWFESKIKSRVLAILITYVLVIGALAALIYGFVALIVGALPSGGIDYTLQLVRAYFDDAISAINDFLSKYFPDGSQANPEDTFSRLQNWFSAKFSFGSMINAVSSITGGITSFLIGAVAAVYLLKDKEFFIRLWEKFMVLILKQRTHGLINETMSQINSVIATFIKGAFVDSLIVAFLSSFALTILKVDFAVIIGVVSGILNIIPYFGPFIGMALAFLVGLFSGGFSKAFLAVILLFLVQQLDSNYIYPKIVGSTIGLHPLFVLLSVSVLGYLFGIIGMLLAVPMAGILQILIKRWAYSKD